MAQKKIKKPEQEVKAVIKWNIPDYIISRFASNMLVQTMENEFKILFFEIKPPIRFAPSDPAPTEVQADCVASIIVTPDRLPKFIEALQKQLARYNLTKKGQ